MADRPPPQIVTQRLLLRMPAQADAELLAAYSSEEKAFLAPWGPIRPAEYYTLQYWQRQEAAQAKALQDDKALLLFVFDRQDAAQVHGRVSFSNFVRGAFQCCSLGYELRERAQGKGLMHEALAAAIAYVFNELNFHRIQANYMPRNARSGRVLDKLGFVTEGCAKNYLLISGEWEEHVLTSLTNANWKRR